MTIRIVALVVLLSTPSAHAGGLRGLEIGGTCTAAFKAELALGSRPTRPLSEIEPDDLLSFSGTHEGQKALIGYTCAAGLVTKQLISFILDTEVEAEAVFDHQYEALRHHLGPPCTDWRKLSLWHRFKLWINDLYFSDALTGVDWDLGDDLQAILNTAPMGPGPDYWAVSIGVSGPPVVLIREQDGSERRVRTPTVCLHRE